MQRRSLLEVAGAATLASLTGCSALPFREGSDVEPRWTAPLGDVFDIGRFQGLVYTASGFRPGNVSAVDPGSGEIFWSCDQCYDFSIADDWLYTDTITGGRNAVGAYNAPLTREWAAWGVFEAATDSRVYLWRNLQTANPDYHGELRALDRGGGTQVWRYLFEHELTGVATAHLREDLYAVVTSADEISVDVHRIDTGTGEQRWHHTVAPGVLPESRLDGDTLYIGTERDRESTQPSVTAVTTLGEQRWQRAWNGYRAVPRWVGGGVVVVSIIRFAGDRQETRALSTESGVSQWVVEELLLTVEDGRAYLVRDGSLIVREVPSGRVQQRLDLSSQLAGDGTSRPQYVIDGETVFIGTGSDVVAVGVSDGEVRWRYSGDGPVNLITVDEGTVYCTMGDSLVALDRQDA